MPLSLLITHSLVTSTESWNEFSMLPILALFVEKKNHLFLHHLVWAQTRKASCGIPTWMLGLQGTRGPHTGQRRSGMSSWWTIGKLSMRWQIQVDTLEFLSLVHCWPISGLVVIFTGILPVCQDEEGLAAVLGHGVLLHFKPYLSALTNNHDEEIGHVGMELRLFTKLAFTIPFSSCATPCWKDVLINYIRYHGCCSYSFRSGFLGLRPDFQSRLRAPQY